MRAPADLLSRGVISFSFEGVSENIQDVHIFFAERWVGEPAESEEMRPAWYMYEEIPYSEMWVDDRQWLPRVLAGETIAARFHLSASGDAILEQEVRLK